MQMRVLRKRKYAGNWRGPFHGVPYGVKDIVDSRDCRRRRIRKYSRITSLHWMQPWCRNCARRAPCSWANCRRTSSQSVDHRSTCRGPRAQSVESRPFLWRVLERFGSGDRSGFPSRGNWHGYRRLRTQSGVDCGVVGMKATYGALVGVVSSIVLLAGPRRTLDAHGAGQCVDAGLDRRSDPLDPAARIARQAATTAALGRGVKGIKIGVIRHFYAQDLQADAEMGAGIETAVQRLAELGAEIREITIAPLAEYAACNRTILTGEAFAITRNGCGSDRRTTAHLRASA